jgi:hypothetical protein
VIIGRQIAAIAYTYAWLLFMILVGQLLRSVDWALALSSWAWFLLGALSVFFLLMLAASYLEVLIVNALKRRNGPGTDD